MRLGLGLGISKSAFVSSITLGQTIAQAHYDRVVADGGVLPVGVAGLSPILDSIIAAYSITSSTDFNTKVPVFLDPSYTGYKLGAGSGTTLGQAAQKVYSVYAGIPQVSDPDAQSFIYRVYTAGGELTTTEANATNQLVLDMKSAGIWTAMKAVYPMVGASAAACAQNLVSSSFTGSFTSGWTFASTGVTPNGTSAYMNSNLIGSTDITGQNSHISFYSRTDSDGLYADTGLGSSMEILTKFGGEIYVDFPISRTKVSNTNSLGNYIISNSLTNGKKAYKNSSIILNTTYLNENFLPLFNILFSAWSSISTQRFSNRQLAFASIGDGLTDTQAANFYTAVQAFQTTLSRQV
jgi:hypothetical protein